MSKTLERPWTIEAFFAWQEHQPDRYELVGGFPLKMMTGAQRIHNAVTINISAALSGRLRGRVCKPFNADDSVETYPGQIRRPDAGVYCGGWNPVARKVEEPRVIIEVLSPSTRDFDTIGKLEEYKSVATVRSILFVEPNMALVIVWERQGDGQWTSSELAGHDAVVRLPSLEIELPLSEIYEDIVFPEKPQRF